MFNNGVISPKIDSKGRNEELDELRRLLRVKSNISEDEINETWNSLRKMQKELEIPSLHPIKQHYYFHQKLEEIRIALDLPFTDFIQLNQLYVEINALRGLLDLHTTTPVSDIIPLIQRQHSKKNSSIDIGSDSLLHKILLFHKTIARQNSIENQERPLLAHKIDRVLYEILVSYGPLSRPELVQLTGIARSSIYDSLRRLMFKGFVFKNFEKRSRTGRPTTLFDALI